MADETSFSRGGLGSYCIADTSVDICRLKGCQGKTTQASRRRLHLQEAKPHADAKYVRLSCGSVQDMPGIYTIFRNIYQFGRPRSPNTIHCSGDEAWLPVSHPKGELHARRQIEPGRHRMMKPREYTTYDKTDHRLRRCRWLLFMQRLSETRFRVNLFTREARLSHGVPV